MSNRFPHLMDDEQQYLDHLRVTSRRMPFWAICAVSMPHPEGRHVSEADSGRIVEFADGLYEYLGPTMSLGLPLFERLTGEAVDAVGIVQNNVQIESMSILEAKENG